MNQWVETIRECRSSGQTVKAWCADHGINTKSYYYWLKRIREAACEALPALGESSSIVPVTIPVQAAGSGPAVSDASQIILRYGSVVLELRNHASAALIENTLRALQNVR
jgi:transposase-like protein